MCSEIGFHRTNQADWFLAIARLPLHDAVTGLVERRHPELLAWAAACRRLLDHIPAAETERIPQGSSFAPANSRFFHLLRTHLAEEAGALVQPLETGTEWPAEAAIRRLRQDHNELLEALDELREELVALASATRPGNDRLKEARDCIDQLDALLNAQVYAEETGVFRRCRSPRRTTKTPLARSSLHFESNR